jgi:hypothetical protein
MTMNARRVVSRLIGAVPVLVLCALTGASVASAGQRSGDAGAATTEKKIIFAEEPAILIVIEGEPVYQPLKGTDLERVTNTKPFIVRDSAGIHYLKVLDGWMQAYGLRGRWSVSGVPPRGAEQELRRLEVANAIDLLETLGKPDNRPHLDDATAPAIFISMTAAELIVMDGPPRYAPLRGTALEYVENTTATVFKEPTDDELYVLTAGGWFRAWTRDGPWQFVPRNELPADIAAVREDTIRAHR